ncbi:LysR substrate-binding domain-containing protein [Pararhodobacter sp.]|uniref:LysR substrate-binding domain-containing protein n=1 Tax=Pararhodobacter sp. TaxID=2127056 RepID=UPI002AFE8E50|nr:LysR substrate-binding domain-containing protein [Pararhodobacter sp.]
MNPSQRRYMPSISAMRCFEAAARHQSFTLAAEELSLTQSAISRQVKELEQIVGAQLFRRTGREVLLTRAGARLANDLAAELENIRRIMLRAVSAGNMNSTLRVAILPTFATLWLIPRLPGFFARNPDIEISFSTRLTQFDLNAENFDVAIHFGKQNWPNATLRKFFSERMIAVASPDFVQKNGIRSFEDTGQAPLLHTSSRPTAWHDYLEQVGFEGRPYLTGRYFDQFSMVIAAAQASLGIGLLPKYLVEKDLQDGRLVAIGDTELVTENSYYFVTPINQEDRNVEKFYQWMIEETNEPSYE